jgi:hypothetical protein
VGTLLKAIGATGDDSLNACRFQILRDRVCAVIVVDAIHLSKRVGIIVRLNAKTATIAVNGSDGHWRVSYALFEQSSTSSRAETPQRSSAEFR